MKRICLPVLAASIAIPIVALACCKRRRPVQRVGMVIGMRPDRISAYEALHAASNPGVRDLLTKHNMHNFSIFLKELEGGQYYLFGYYEYKGKDYKADMEKLSIEPRNRDWLAMTGQMQIPLPGERSWSIMREVYYNA